ncbi:MAG: NAD(P)/FAD-dependent oxidoreductase [Candidatus Puniceispirillales bacterium]
MTDQAGWHSIPRASHYDVVVIGGAMMGASVAWFLKVKEQFPGSVLIIERDPSYEYASTSHTNSCIRQQFSNPLNIRISQFGAAFIKTFREQMGSGPDVPDIPIQNFGYMYLADNDASAQTIVENQRLQASLGAGTMIMTPDEIAARYPFYHLDDIVLGSHNTLDEGYFDGGTIFDWWKRQARQHGVEMVAGEVTALSHDGRRVTGVTLASGEVIAAGEVVNATGPRAARTAAMLGIDLPVEPRRRYTFIFDAATPLPCDLPLTIDPSGVHVRTDGRYYLCGCPPDDDPAVDAEDFDFDHSIWENKVWPAIATRIPAFEAIKLINSWVGHYAYNTLDQNAIIGRHPFFENFIFINGFSGHGLQQSPAMGRAVAELICHGQYISLDMTPLGFDRIQTGDAFVEKAVI